MTDDPRLPHDDELVPEDDAVIGRALRRSLIGLLAAVLLVGVVLLFLRLRGEEQAADVEIATAAPVTVEEEVEAPTLRFTDVTSDAGIDFVHENGATGEKLLPETMGSGVAFFDLEDDGDADLLLLDGATWPGDPVRESGLRLYRNDGKGGFSDVTAGSGLDTTLYGTGVAVADADGDGLRDVFVAAVGANRFFRGLGGGRFEDATGTAGLAGGTTDWSTSAGFLDIEGDGDLDLFVCNYVVWSRDVDLEVDYKLTGVGRAYGPPVNYQGTHSKLYRNEGDGTFTDVSAEAGIEVTNPATGVPAGKALGLALVDLDRDGFTDVFVANDTVGNFLFHNRGDGTFEEVGEIAGVAYGRAGEATGAMGVDAAFYRNDDDLGFVIGNFANEMTSMYVSQGDPNVFTDEAIGEGVGAPSRTALTFGMLLLDVDLDGRLDLLQTNGHLETEISTVDPSQSYEQASQLFWNAGPEQRHTFVEVAPEGLGDLARPIVGRSSAAADIDLDGDVDVLLTQVGREPLLLRNDQALGHHWLRVRLVDATSTNADALGARVELEAGGVVQRRAVSPTRSYQSQSELPITFGLGGATAVDALRIVWPDGSEETVAVEGVDRSVVVRRTADGTVVEAG